MRGYEGTLEEEKEGKKGGKGDDGEVERNFTVWVKAEIDAAYFEGFFLHRLHNLPSNPSSLQHYHHHKTRSLFANTTCFPIQGISLTLEQFNTLITLIPHIEAVLADKGESVVRPNYSGEQPALVNEPRGKEEDSGGGKKNFEATSEEE